MKESVLLFNLFSKNEDKEKWGRMREKRDKRKVK